MKNAPVSLFLFRAGMLAVLGALPLSAWCGVAGQFQFVAGDVRILAANGQSRPAQKGQDISEGETVVTGANASAQLKMIDGGILALRPESQLKMDAYVFKGREDGSEKANMSLVKGGLRAISGLIGKTNKQNYAITTPTATIGIRGTDHEPVVVLPPPPGQTSPNPPGTYDKVNVGQVALSNQVGSTLVNRNQVGFAGAPNLPPSVLLRVPDFYRVTPLPAQRQQQQGGQGGNSASSNSGNASNPSTTSAASGSSGGDAMRLNSGDNVPTPNVVNSSGTGVVSNVGVTPSAPPSTVLTAKDTQGNDVNLTAQTEETSAGTVALGGTKVSPSTPATGTYKGHYDIVYGGGDSLLFGNSSYGSLSTLTLENNKLVGLNVLEQYLGDIYKIKLDGSVAESQRDSDTGLVWGRFSSGNLSYSINAPGEDSSLAETVPMPDGGLHYIVGTKPAPDYLSRVITGRYDYAKIGGTRPSDNFGRLGTLTDASLKVNFTNQLVEQAIVAFSMPDASWRLTASDMPLQGSGQFMACSDCGGSNLSVVRTQGADSRSGYGFLIGTLTGSNLNGAALSYQVQDSVTTSLAPTTIQGVAALGVVGSAPDANTPYRATGISSGWKMTGTDLSSSSYWSSEIENLTQVSYKGSVEGGEAPVNRVIDNNNALVEFAGQAEYQRAGIDGLTNSGGPNSATVRIGTAVNRDVGSMAVDGMTVSWGRWAGGTVDIFNRDGTGARLGTIDNTDRSIHWLATSSVAGPLVNLPLSGSATYTLAGGGATSPTDTRGNVGTLTSATVDVYFATMRVNAQVTLNINATAVGISAQQMVLNSGGGFSSNGLLSTTGGATVSCGSACGSNSMAYINGQLLGPNASVAAIAYGAALAPPVTNTNTFQAPQGSVISGVAVLKNAGPVPSPH